MFFHIIHDHLSTMPNDVYINLQGQKMKAYGNKKKKPKGETKEEADERTNERTNEERKKQRKDETNDQTKEHTNEGTNERNGLRPPPRPISGSFFIVITYRDGGADTRRGAGLHSGADA